jgi:serine/threonine protein kinase
VAHEEHEKKAGKIDAGEEVYLVMEYLAGGGLFMQLQKERMLMEDTAIFYLAQVLLAIEHLQRPASSTET